MSRAAIYVRISRDDDGQGLGVERQEADCRALVKRRGWDLVEVFADNDISASTLSKKARPGYAAMLDAAKAGTVDAVAAYSNSRLTRRPAEWIDLINLANAGALTIATVASGEHDLATADGRAVALTIAAWDAAEAERTGERASRQRAQRAASGRASQGRWRLLGYGRDWSVVPDEAAIVREIFERRLGGQSSTGIAKILNERGLKTTAGNRWTQASVAGLLTRAAYAGLVVHRGRVVGPGDHEALVTEEVWRAANSGDVKRAPGQNARRYLASGIALCGHCQTGMMGGAGDECYRCSRAAGGCGRLSIRRRWVDDLLVSLVLDREHRRVITPSPSHQPDLDRIDAEIAELRAMHTRGDLDLLDLVPLLKDKRAARSQIEKQMSAAVVASTGYLPALRDWNGLDLSQQRSLIGRHVAHVVVGPRQAGSGPLFDPTRLTIHWRDGEVEPLTTERMRSLAQRDSAAGVLRPMDGLTLLADANVNAAERWKGAQGALSARQIASPRLRVGRL